MSNNDRSMAPVILLAMALISLALGIIAYLVLEKGVLVIAWVFALVFGVALAITSMAYSGKSNGTEPSDKAYRFSSGMLLAIVGLVGTVSVFADTNWLYYVAIILVGIAITGVVVALMNKSERNA